MRLCISSRATYALKHPPEDDQYGYEDAGERWLPVHTVESIVRQVIQKVFCHGMLTLPLS
jgi:hypothetical protein